jgi:hypothetical protein
MIRDESGQNFCPVNFFSSKVKIWWVGGLRLSSTPSNTPCHTCMLQAAQMRLEAEPAGAAPEARKKAKFNQYFEQCQAVGIEFVPLILESLGGCLAPRGCQLPLFFSFSSVSNQFCFFPSSLGAVLPSHFSFIYCMPLCLHHIFCSFRLDLSETVKFYSFSQTVYNMGVALSYF